MRAYGNFGLKADINLRSDRSRMIVAKVEEDSFQTEPLTGSAYVTLQIGPASGLG